MLKKLNNNTLIFTFISIVLLFSVSKCYEKRELDDLAYVIAIGVDKGEVERFKITAQFALPVKIGGGSTTGKKTISLLSVESPSIYGADSIINAIISKEITIAHNKLLVISSELAQKGLEDYVVPFISSTELRPRTSIIVCDGNASDFLSIISPTLESSPARYYDLILNTSKYSGYSISSELLEFYMNSQSPCRDAVTIFASIIGDENPEEGQNNTSNKDQGFQNTQDISDNEQETQTQRNSQHVRTRWRY